MEKTENTINKSDKKGLTKKQWILICIVCAAAAAAIIIIAVMNNEGGNDKVYQDLKQDLVSTITVDNPAPELNEEIITPLSQVTFAPKRTDNSVISPDRIINFAELKEINDDVIGWISVEGTEIDYPIMMSRDNADYLTTDIHGNENANGSIFMDMANKLNFSDRNTVIYGHNMKNGSMFAGLHKFEDPEFFGENREIKLYTRDGMRVYDIVAAYLTGDDNVLYANDFTNDEEWLTYVDNMLKNENANVIDTEIDLDDRILTLSTCQRGEAEHRYFVVGLLRDNVE